jgi:hypothetical protein
VPDPQPQPMRFGGCFAPPLTDSLLSAYATLIKNSEPSAVRDAMQCCVDCVKQWWALPESTSGGSPHPSGRGQIVPLDEDCLMKIDEQVPWDHELYGIQTLFDGMPAGPARECAFHLLWHVRELALGREPITTDKL